MQRNNLGQSARDLLLIFAGLAVLIGGIYFATHQSLTKVIDNYIQTKDPNGS